MTRLKARAARDDAVVVRRLFVILLVLALLPVLGVGLRSGSASASHDPVPAREPDQVVRTEPGTTSTASARAARTVKARPVAVRSTVAGARYVATALVRTTSPSVRATLRLREVHRGTLQAQKSAHRRIAHRGWARLSLTFVARGAGHRLALTVAAPRHGRGHALVVSRVTVRRVWQKQVTPRPVVAVPAPVGAIPTPDPDPDPAPDPVVPAQPGPAAIPPAEPAQPAPGSAPAPRTLWGATVWMDAGETYATALAQAESTYGRFDMTRVFYAGLPAPWPGQAGLSGRDVSVSFKGDPVEIVNGLHDDRLRAWFASAPRDRTIWWTYWHEPEDEIRDGRFTAAQYRDAWRHLATLADEAGNPRLRATLILMCWTLEPQVGRDWTEYFAGNDVIDVLGWDCYNLGSGRGRYDAPSVVFDRAIATSRAAGLPFAIAELGSLLVAGDDGSGRAAWMAASAAYLDDAGAQYVAWFDAPVAGEYRLLDRPSVDAWSAILAAT